jgi:predicted enzyme related to lactoylglutathione lyase
MLVNFFVDDLQAEQSRLEGQGVRFIRTAGREEWGGVISTFLDPDGNYCQLIEYRPEGA